MTKFTSSLPDPNDSARESLGQTDGGRAAGQEHLTLGEGAGAGAVVLEPNGPVIIPGELEERVAALESYVDAVASATDDQRKEAGTLEARIAALEARTRDATINADIVSLQGKVAGLEDQVGARQAVAIAELATRVDALEART